METSREQNTDKLGGAHWSNHPWKLLAGALAALLVANIVAQAAYIATSHWINSSISHWPVVALYSIIPPVLELMLVAAFYGRVRAARRKHGVDNKACWRPGVVFFIGLGLLLAAALLICLPIQSENFNIPVIATEFLSFAASGLVLLLVFHLLMPIFEKSMSGLRGAWALGAGFAVLAVLKQISALIIGRNASSFLSADFILGTLLPLCVSAFALTAVRIFLYQRASRRMPGAWMLFSSIPALLAVACSAIRWVLYDNGGAPHQLSAFVSHWLRPLVDSTFYLIVLAIGLGLITAFQRWKTFGAFWKDTKVVLRRTQGDIIE
jgi:hypothetical protein